MAVLGISTNTRLLGRAIITEDGFLTDYSIHLFKASWSPSKITEIITSLEPCVRRYCIKSVVLSIPHAHHQTEAFKELLIRISEFFITQGVPVYTETPEAIRCLCPAREAKTKKVLMMTLAARFPQLRPSYERELRNKNKYYYKLFEAVAVAHLQGH